MSTKFCHGISDISDSYMGFIIDQWGVLHDGNKPFDGVVECLKQLKERGKHVIILSNSGKTSAANKERMKDVGIGPSLYNEIITSGEMTWQGLNDQENGVFNDIGKKCYLMSRGGDRSIVDGLDIEIVDDIDQADFLLISGSDAPEKTIEDYEPALRGAARRQLKAICANPDSLAILRNANVMGAGSIARRYIDFGGVVEYIGKPHPPIFQHCMNILRDKNIYAGQTIMVGDSMAHDILGGSLASIDTCLVKDGLHKATFQNAKTLIDMEKALNNLSVQHNNVRPTYMVNKFHWGKALPDRKHKKKGDF